MDSCFGLGGLFSHHPTHLYIKSHTPQLDAFPIILFHIIISHYNFISYHNFTVGACMADNPTNQFRFSTNFGRPKAKNLCTFLYRMPKACDFWEGRFLGKINVRQKGRFQVGYATRFSLFSQTLTLATYLRYSRLLFFSLSHSFFLSSKRTKCCLRQPYFQNFLPPDPSTSSLLRRPLTA